MSPTFAPLQHAAFRTLWGAALASNLGSLIQAVAAGWVMATISDSHLMVALVQSATTLPIMIFSLASGAVADSFDRRRVMLAAQIAMCLVSVLLAAFAYLDWLTPWLLLGCTFLIGCGMALYNPSWQASIADLVPRADIAGAVNLNSMSYNATRSVGPAIGGFIVAAAGVPVAFMLNAISYLPLTVALARWRPAYPERTLPREALLSAVGSGLRYVSMSPTVLAVLYRGLFFGLGATSLLALLPVMVRDVLGGGVSTFGTMLGAFGLGAIVGAMFNGRLRERLGNEAIVRLACAVMAAATALFAMSENAWLSHVLLLPAGAFWVVALSLFNVSVQLSTPRWVVGRALSIYQMATFGGMAVGGWIWGEVADAYTPQVALLGAALVLALTSLAGLRYALPAFNALDLDPIDRFREPTTRLDLRGRSGPIVVMIDYDIEHADVAEFLAAMAQRRRIRIRNGARRWALLRDVENPQIWTESYHVPTWTEYVRHNQRLTKADAEVSDTLKRLNKGRAPRVHRMIERQTVSPSDNLPLKPHSDIH